MRIAQVAPLSESVPPKLYGGTERVVYGLTEELTRRGHFGITVVEAMACGAPVCGLGLAARAGSNAAVSAAADASAAAAPPVT